MKEILPDFEKSSRTAHVLSSIGQSEQPALQRGSKALERLGIKSSPVAAAPPLQSPSVRRNSWEVEGVQGFISLLDPDVPAPKTTTAGHDDHFVVPDDALCFGPLKKKKTKTSFAFAPHLFVLLSDRLEYHKLKNGLANRVVAGSIPLRGARVEHVTASEFSIFTSTKISYRFQVAPGGPTVEEWTTKLNTALWSLLTTPAQRNSYIDAMFGQ